MILKAPCSLLLHAWAQSLVSRQNPRLQTATALNQDDRAPRLPPGADVVDWRPHLEDYCPGTIEWIHPPGESCPESSRNRRDSLFSIILLSEHPGRQPFLSSIPPHHPLLSFLSIFSFFYTYNCLSHRIPFICFSIFFHKDDSCATLKPCFRKSYW